MDSKKSNKITEIVKLQQILKKWRKFTNATKATSNNGNGNKSIKFLKRTLSMSENSSVPKGYLAVSVGEEQKRYIIPTDYLSHQAFHVLLREAEEEFGFQQRGILRIPCEVPVFENVLKIMEEKKKDAYFMMYECSMYISDDALSCCSSDCQKTPSHCSQSPLCR